VAPDVAQQEAATPKEVQPTTTPKEAQSTATTEPAPVQAEASPAVAAVVEFGAQPKRSGDLVQDLINEERFAEALLCRKHFEAIKLLEAKNAAYKVAKEADNLEEAFALRASIKALRSAVQPDDVVARWNVQDAAGPLATAIKARRARRPEMGSAEEDAAFWQRSHDTLLRLAQTDLDAAALALKEMIEEIDKQ